MRCFSNDRVVRCGLIATSQRYPSCLMLRDCAPRFDSDVMVLTTVLRYSGFWIFIFHQHGENESELEVCGPIIVF